MLYLETVNTIKEHVAHKNHTSAIQKASIPKEAFPRRNWNWVTIENLPVYQKSYGNELQYYDIKGTHFYS